jgi:YfiH family protein
MIRPEGFRGAAFGTAADGDARTDPIARVRFAAALEVSPDWAYVHQVHGAAVVTAAEPGLRGDADAIITAIDDLPLCVATADCVPVIIEGERTTAAVHAGWRGIVAGVVEATMAAIRDSGDVPLRAAVGPAIGPCCYEVGDEVLDRLAPFAAETTWGSTSVDLPAAVAARLGSLPMWQADRCTFDSEELNSYRRDRTKSRQVAVTWLPRG